MKIHIDPVISSRIKQAWSALPALQQSRIAPMLARASQQAMMVSQTRQAPPTSLDVPHQALLARSAINDDKDQVIGSLSPGLFIDVGPGGELWGTGKYEQLDPGWVEAAAVWLENFFVPKAPFVPGPPAVINIDDSVQIAIAGDWGTGDWRTAANPAPSTDVARHIGFLKPDYTIHLGDAYYAGTLDEEKHLLTSLWPSGTKGSLALNSNHEMYSGARGYFSEALANPKFAIQGGSSFFALQNANWVIVGLDSAYFADEEGLYMDGALVEPSGLSTQISFLSSQIATGKRVIVLSHHGGLSLDGATRTNLFREVTSAFPGGAPASFYWYWGHEHAAAVYLPQGPGNILCRCCGHGGIPWGRARALQGNPNVAWYESRSANDPDIPQRVLNGFAMLTFDGPNLKETFYDENGGVALSLG